MNTSRRIWSAFVTGIVVAAAGPGLAEGTVIKVSLWDKGSTSLDQMGQPPGMGMAVEGADLSTAMVGIKADRDTAPAGKVTFEVVNDSKVIVHEMVVAAADPAVPLPYNVDEQGISEDAASPLGEVSELDPGASGSLELNLKPGKYILFCNVPGHYMLGMWTLLTVTG